MPGLNSGTVIFFIVETNEEPQILALSSSSELSD